MSVVQRCPNCGTTQASAGECEACQEAQVRYFCTNHTPGLWLETSACGQCGARFGEPERAVAAPVAPTPARARPPAAARGPAARSEAPAPYSRRAPEPRDEWERGDLRSPDDRRLSPGASPIALMQKLLQAALRARYMPTRAAPDRAMPAVGRAAGGCLMRLLLVAFVLFVMLATAVFVFGRALLGGY